MLLSPLRQDISIKRSRSRRVLLLLALVLLLAGGGYWYWRSLQPYHVVLSFDDAKPILVPRATGFLVGGEATPYAFYDWQGTRHWRVEEHHRGRYLRVGDVLTETEKRCALSPDGRFLSVIDSATWATRAELRTWREGKPYRKMTVPVGAVSDLHQLNDGSVYVSGKRQSESPRLLLVQGARVAAAVADYRLLDISVDGGTALVQDTAGRTLRTIYPCAVSIVTDRIVLRPVTVRYDCCSVYDKAVLLFSDGFLHRAGVTKPLARRVPIVRLIGLAGRGAAFDLQGRVMAVTPETGRTWSFPVKKGYAIVKGSTGVSDDGRFVAITFQHDAYLRLRRLYALVPPLARLLPKRTRQEVLLYARPGRLVATPSDVFAGQTAVVGFPWYPAPDGRAVIGLTIDSEAQFHGVLLRRR